ncbi:MAG: hypothetical protein M3N13_07935 [Candidatus Eremiobacteraeota bacterium]|nr:hypothetical protein [Candidatus Eremiobacteraeota bacterium]
MTNGDFGAELRQSVKESLDAISSELARAKARIADGIAGVATPQAPPEPPAAEADPQPSRRYNVSFDDVAGQEAPVWEDPP